MKGEELREPSSASSALIVKSLPSLGLNADDGASAGASARRPPSSAQRPHADALSGCGRSADDDADVASSAPNPLSSLAFASGADDADELSRPLSRLMVRTRRRGARAPGAGHRSGAGTTVRTQALLRDRASCSRRAPAVEGLALRPRRRPRPAGHERARHRMDLRGPGWTSPGQGPSTLMPCGQTSYNRLIDLMDLWPVARFSRPLSVTATRTTARGRGLRPPAREGPPGPLPANKPSVRKHLR